MKCGKAIAAIISLVFFTSPAITQQGLIMFKGTWVSVYPTPGQQFSFNKTSGGGREVSLPLLGHATITASNGKDNSNLKVSGEGFDCYYRFTQVGPGEMLWTLKSGPPACPASTHFKRVSP